MVSSALAVTSGLRCIGKALGLETFDTRNGALDEEHADQQHQIAEVLIPICLTDVPRTSAGSR